MSLWKVFRHLCVRRWHTHHVMSRHPDYLYGHIGRCACYARLMFPGDHALIDAILAHDSGEHATADVASHLKARMPIAFRRWWDDLERDTAATMWGRQADDCDPHRLRLCDKLDAVMWVAANEPRLLREPGWRADMAEVEALGIACGVSHLVTPALMEARGMVP